jgi:hypothetical protein
MEYEKTENPMLHQKTFQELTTDELYELLRVRSEVFVVEHMKKIIGRGHLLPDERRKGQGNGIPAL